MACCKNLLQASSDFDANRANTSGMYWPLLYPRIVLRGTFECPVNKDCINKWQDNVPGPDDISHRMLIATKNTICRPLCKLFNLSLRKKCFPSFWKLANVIAVFKKSDKSIASNYIPISLLSCVSKIFERTVFKYVFIHISRHKYVHKLQSGFLPGYSTTHHTDGIWRLFADDASLGHTNNDLQNLHDMVNSDPSNIRKWSKDWLITFNPDKTDIRIFDNRRQGYLSFNLDKPTYYPLTSINT